MQTSRRILLAQAGAGLLAGPSLAAPLRPTPQETSGPFYPVHPPREHDADLTRLAGRRERAKGQIIEVRGRVLRQDGSPASGAELKIWQANAAGRYTHPADDNKAPLDPNFEGYALISAAADGSWRILTVKPGAYPAPQGMRTPHIHFEVTGRQYRLGAQMYFPGESLNEQDFLLGTLATRKTDPAQVIAAATPSAEPGVMAFSWDIVLRDA